MCLASSVYDSELPPWALALGLNLCAPPKTNAMMEPKVETEVVFGVHVLPTP